MSAAINLEFLHNLCVNLGRNRYLRGVGYRVCRYVRANQTLPYILVRTINISNLAQVHTANFFEIESEIDIFTRETCVIESKKVLAEIEGVLTSLECEITSYNYVSGKIKSIHFSDSNDLQTHKTKIVFFASISQKVTSRS